LRRRRLRSLLRLSLTATLLPVIPLILAIVLRRLRNHRGLLRLLDLRLCLRSRRLLLTASLLSVIPLILAIVLRRLRNHHGLLRLLDLRLSLRSRQLLLTAASLPVILAIVLRRLRNHHGLLRLLNLRLSWLPLEDAPSLLAATLLLVIVDLGGVLRGVLLAARLLTERVSFPLPICAALGIDLANLTTPA
jgi:hypothetical protein